MFWKWMQRGDEIKKEIVLHRLWCQVWVSTKPLCYNTSKWGYSGEFVDESRKAISGLAQNRVIPLADIGSRQLLDDRGLTFGGY